MAEMDNIRLIIRFLPAFFGPDSLVVAAVADLARPDMRPPAAPDDGPLAVVVVGPAKQEVELASSGLLARAEASRAAARCLFVSVSMVCELLPAAAAAADDDGDDDAWDEWLNSCEVVIWRWKSRGVGPADTPFGEPGRARSADAAALICSDRSAVVLSWRWNAELAVKRDLGSCLGG